MADSEGAVMVVVPSDWTTETAIGLSESGYKSWAENMVQGQRVLIYKAAPVDAVIGEGEVPDQIGQRLDDWPATTHQQPLTGLGQPAEYLLPLRILYTRAQTNYVPLSEVRKWVNAPDFPQVEWLPLPKDAYQAMTNWP